MNARQFLELQEAYQGVYDEIDESTAMSRRGYDETKLRQRPGGGEAADRATALEKKPTFGDANKAKQRQRYARAQRNDFRQTASSNPGLHGYAHNSDDPSVQAKQEARGAQRRTLTPNERRQLNMGDESFDTFDAILEHLVAEGYADTNENAIAIMANMSEEWRDSILDEAYVDYRRGRLPSGRTPQQAARERKSALSARQERDEVVGIPTGSDAANKSRTQKRRLSKQSDTVSMMDRSTTLGSRLNGGMVRGEPNTGPHQNAIDRRRAIKKAQEADRTTRS